MRWFILLLLFREATSSLYARGHLPGSGGSLCQALRTRTERYLKHTHTRVGHPLLQYYNLTTRNVIAYNQMIQCIHLTRNHKHLPKHRICSVCCLETVKSDNFTAFPYLVHSYCKKMSLVLHVGLLGLFRGRASYAQSSQTMCFFLWSSDSAVRCGRIL